MTHNGILLYSEKSDLLNNHQRSFLLQQVGKNAEIHTQTLCREWETLGYTATDKMCPSNPSHQDSGNPKGE